MSQPSKGPIDLTPPLGAGCCSPLPQKDNFRTHNCQTTSLTTMMIPTSTTHGHSSSSCSLHSYIPVLLHSCSCRSYCQCCCYILLLLLLPLLLTRPLLLRTVTSTTVNELNPGGECNTGKLSTSLGSWRRSSMWHPAAVLARRTAS